MAKYTLTITDNTTHKTINTQDFDALFAGYANEERHGRIVVAEATGLVIAIALNSAKETIKAVERENPIAHAARMFLKECEKRKEESESENEDE